MKVNFYIDGFNFYFGLRDKSKEFPHWKKYYWLDMLKLCNNFIGEGQQIQKIKYFTAPPLSEGKRTRQEAFLNANKFINKGIFEVHNGKYVKQKIKCRACSHESERPEEKRTDVNIATHMIGDCYNKEVDKIILLTADSDLLPPIEFILDNVKDAKVKLILPPCRKSYDLTRYMKSKKQSFSRLDNSEDVFRMSMMPDAVITNTVTYTRPDNWK